MRNQDAERAGVFARRAALLAGVETLAFGALGYRLWSLQIDASPRYRLLAEDNRASQRLLLPPRGRILDRAGRVLADNSPSYRVRVVRERAGDLRALLEAIDAIAPIGEERIEEVIAIARSRAAFAPVTVRDDLRWSEVAALSARAPELPGCVLDAALHRLYPHEDVLAHVVGYVGPVDEREQEADDDPLLSAPDFRIGKNGVEKVYDHRLRGSAGWSRIEVNAFGRELRELERDDGAPGEDLPLTLDLELQRFVHNRIGAEPSASAVVMDVANGDLLALASTPAFRPGAFTNGVSHGLWDAWRSNPRAPLLNKSIRGEYPPGSTFKMITALTALELGAVDPRTEVHCGGVTRLGRARFHCWREHGHGSLSMVQAIAQSCDVYFYELARKVGVDAIAETARKFGLGAPTGVDLPGEKAGLIPTRAWKERAIGEKWQRGETLVIGIGQGFVLSTPIQLAVMTARLANGGKRVTPRFVRPEGLDPPLAAMPDIGVSREALAPVLAGMHEVVNGERGTARSQKLRLPGMTYAGKTGTSQVRRITQAERATGAHKRKDRPWEERDHGLYVCFAPFEQPRYAISVIVEHGGGGSTAAAPIARDIAQWVVERDPSGALDALKARIARETAAIAPSDGGRG